MLPSIVCADDAAYRRDAALFDVISKHGFRPVVWQISETAAAELAKRFAAMFRFPVLDNVPDDARDSARKKSDAALLRAIGKCG